MPMKRTSDGPRQEKLGFVDPPLSSGGYEDVQLSVSAAQAATKEMWAPGEKAEAKRNAQSPGGAYSGI